MKSKNLTELEYENACLKIEILRLQTELEESKSKELNIYDPVLLATWENR